MSVVIDASALLAVLLEETGRDFVLPSIRGGRFSTVNLSETMSRALDRGHSAERVERIVRRFEILIEPFTATQARRAAELQITSRHLGLSMGDRACLALALERGLPVLTGDRRMAEFDAGIDIRLIR